MSLPDYSRLADTFFTSDPATDINGDGFVNVLDYSLTAGNWYIIGDPE